MNRQLAETVVASLHFCSAPRDLNHLRDFTERDWRGALRWLDNSGLALYFLQRLKALGSTDVLPPSILNRFEQNLVDNQGRVDHIAQQLGLLNDRFEQAGVNCAVVKGLSLVPAYCPDACLRPQADLDYLVDERSLFDAQRVLGEAGYRPGKFSKTEFKFWRPSPGTPLRPTNPYSIGTEPLVELQLAFWRPDLHGVPLEEPRFVLDCARTRKWRGLQFRVLDDEDTFLLQVIHTFQHLLDYWVRLSWLLEVAHFLNERSSDAQFWHDVDDRVQRVPNLAEFAAIVMGLASKLFGAPMPTVAASWTQCLRPAAKLWLNRYGQRWVYGDYPLHERSLFPAAKLSLFLHQEYVPNLVVRRAIIRRRLLPWKKPQRIAVAVNEHSPNLLPADWLQWQFVLRRLIFHVGSSLRYLWETPRWRRLTRLQPDCCPRSF